MRSTTVRFPVLIATCAAIVTIACASDYKQPPPAATPPDPFAMCSNPNVLTHPDYIEAMIRAGARMCRVDVSFKEVRADPGDDPDKWNWTPLQNIHLLKDRYAQMDWLPILGYGTAWAAEQGRLGTRPLAAPMRGADVWPAWDPRNLYGNYVYEAVSRYKSDVHVWESWNEPDLPGHTFFNGSGFDFFPYQKACYLAAKHADPTCKVTFAAMCFASVEGYLASHGLHAPSPSPPQLSFFEEYLKACASDPDAKRNNFYFDIMNQHSYSRASDIYDYAAVDKKLMRDYIGAEKPIWFTETGTVDRGGPFGGTADEYCDYLLQSYAWSALAGVQRMFHFQLDNSNGHGLYGGMLGDPKPALATYKDVLTRLFYNAHFAALLHGTHGSGFLENHTPYFTPQRAGYDLFEFTALNGRRRLFIAFSDTDREVRITIPATRAAATLVDRHGEESQVKAANGVYSIVLPGATNEAGWPVLDDPKAKAMGDPEHLVGGATFVLVEGPEDN